MLIEKELTKGIVKDLLLEIWERIKKAAKKRKCPMKKRNGLMICGVSDILKRKLQKP